MLDHTMLLMDKKLYFMDLAGQSHHIHHVAQKNTPNLDNAHEPLSSVDE